MTEIHTLLSGAWHYLVPFLVVLSVVVFVHEFGHYIVARLCGVKIETFSIGFGREIFGWTDKTGTRWKISWMPLGGYVKMFGDADASSALPDAAVKSLPEAERRQTFYAKNVFQRFAIVAAGPSFNYLFAVLVMGILFATAGQTVTPPVANEIIEGSAAARAGFQVGDRIEKVDGASIARFEDLRRIVSLNQGTPLALEVNRNGVVVPLVVTPDLVVAKDRFGGEHRLGRLGLMSREVNFVKLDPASAVWQAVLETWHLTTATLQAVGQMIVGVRGAEELGGPLRIAEMSGKVAADGFAALAWFLAVISVNLGLINFFPIPLLDGGNLVFYLFEMVLRRPLSEKLQEAGARLGLVFVVSLMVFATWNDLVHLRVISYLTGLFS